MSNISRRRTTHPHPAYTTRRTLLKLAAAAPFAVMPVAAAGKPVADCVPAPMAGYYAFLLMEIAAIEDMHGLTEMHAETARAGAERGATMHSGSTVTQRYEWLSHFTDTRVLFTPREA